MSKEFGLILPDYAMPSALMVPHHPVNGASMLEEIAKTAARFIGVILLSHDTAYSQQFISRQADQDRFSVVGAGFDTPWIRDRSPIAVRLDDEINWILPRLPEMNREKDDELFGQVTLRSTIPAPLSIEQGNLVAGPDGLVLSTHRVLQVNGFTEAEPLVEAAGPLGIRRWVIFPPFTEELSGHADVHARFLAQDLLAIAWNPDDRGNMAISELIEEQVVDALPDVRVVRIPMRRDGKKYASLVNWIQLGQDLLVPKFAMTPDADLDKARSLLFESGFSCHFIDSPTDELGGSLHCMTASIFV